MVPADWRAPDLRVPSRGPRALLVDGSVTNRLLEPFSLHSLTESRNEGKPYIGLGFSTVFSESQIKDPIVTARLFRNPHVVFDARFSCQKAIRFFGIELVRQPAAQMARSIAHQSNVLWSRVCQVSGESNVIASESISVRGHGRLLWTWDLVPNDLLSVSRSSWSRTPNAVCVMERSRQPRRSEPIFSSVPRERITLFSFGCFDP